MTLRLTILLSLLLALPAVGQPSLPKVFVRPVATNQIVIWAWGGVTSDVEWVFVAVGSTNGWIQTNRYSPSVMSATFTNVPAFSVSPTNYAKAWCAEKNGPDSPVITASWSGNDLIVTVTNPTTNLLQQASGLSSLFVTAPFQNSTTLTNPPSNMFYRLANLGAVAKLSGVATKGAMALRNPLVVVQPTPLPNVLIASYQLPRP